jgi:PAS domain S-box-containing protein
MSLVVLIFVGVTTPTALFRQVFAAVFIYLTINLALGFVSRVTLRRKRIRAFPAVLDLAFTSYLVFLTGGENSVWYLLYVFPILSVSRYLSYEGSVFLALVAAIAYAIAAYAGAPSVHPPALILKGMILLGIAFVAGNLSRTRKRKEDDLVEVFRKIDDAIIADVETDRVLKIILENAVAFTESSMGQMTVFGEDQFAYFVSVKSDKKQPDWLVDSLTALYHDKVRQTKRPLSVLTIKGKKRNGNGSDDQVRQGAKAHIYILRAHVENPENMPRAALFVPLILNDEVRAIISLYSKHSFHYVDIDAVKLESLAPALGIALKHSSEIEKTQRLKLLHRIGETLKVEQGLSEIFKTVVALTWTQLGSEEAALFVLDEKQRDGAQIRKVAVKGPTDAITLSLAEIERPYKSGESFVGEIFATTQLKHLPTVHASTLHYDKYAETLPSRVVKHYIGVPIVIGDQVLGVLRVINKRSSTYSVEDENFELSETGFGPEDVELMQTIASQVASAIHSANFIELNRYYGELVENSPDPIIVLDQDGNVTVFNRACEAIWGLPAREVLGNHVNNYYESAQHAREIGHLLKNAPDKRIQDFQARIRARDGEIIPISLSASVLFDVRGKRLGSIGVFKDLRATLKLQEEKTNAERLATLGKLAHTVGHEIKHDIATALNYIDVLAFESGEDEDLARTYREIQESLVEAVDKFQNMLLVGRPKPPQKEIIGATDLFTMIESSMRRRAEYRNVEFVLDYPDDTKELEADITQLRQVLFNLFDNSLDAIDAKRVTECADERGLVECQASANNGNLQINWNDSGCGIASGGLDTIFTPFVTSKSTGNGLGLFIVKSIIDNHGGQVTVKSEEGKGTNFTIVLPLLPANESPA